MSKKIIAFDLDGTLAISKSAVSEKMSGLIGELLQHFHMCIISGGKFEQFKKQVIDRLSVPDELMEKLHIMPTCGTRYYRFNKGTQQWAQLYAEDFTQDEKKNIIDTLEEVSKSMGYWAEKPWGEIIEDRGSQITYSALGQQAPIEEKEQWDADGKKKAAIRDAVAAKLTNYEVRSGGTTSIDVTTKGIDKAYGMRKIQEELQITPAEILFVGDALEPGGNDYPVKAAGIDTITVRNWEDTALVIEALVKNR